MIDKCDILFSKSTFSFFKKENSFERKFCKGVGARVTMAGDGRSPALLAPRTYLIGNMFSLYRKNVAGPNRPRRLPV
jgi:hypothetical protein